MCVKPERVEGPSSDEIGGSQKLSDPTRVRMDTDPENFVKFEDYYTSFDVDDIK